MEDNNDRVIIIINSIVKLLKFDHIIRYLVEQGYIHTYMDGKQI